ncbi:MAG: hypothetical protein IPG80_03525 [Anaerolineales bacterium]|uniref:hypothetical protein n=1 Tax=Candidatus Villigracilis vicinus TaxID=3140679 RepID=UPI0031367510|nr:hypothetical protein [Anaerolineales bacterium]
MGQQFIALMYSHFYIVLSAFLLSIYFSILAVKDEKRRWLYFIASYLLAAVNLLTMEYFTSWNLGGCSSFSTPARHFKERTKKAILYFLPYFTIFLGVTFWRMFFFNSKMPVIPMSCSIN